VRADEVIEFEFPWLLERKIAGFGTLEDLVHVSRSVSVRLDRVAAAWH